MGVLVKVYCTLTEVLLNLTEVFLTLNDVFPCFFLSCKANARLKLTKTGHGPHYSALFHISCYLCRPFVICVVRLLFVLFYVYVLPPGENPIAVNKYINIKYHWYSLLLETRSTFGPRCGRTT